MTSLQTLTTLLILLGPTLGLAASQVYYVNDRPVTKIEAIRALINDANAPVTKCQPVMLSERATLVIRKAQQGK